MRIIILDYEVVVYFTVTLHHITLQQQLSSLVMDLLTWLKISVKKTKQNCFNLTATFRDNQNQCSRYNQTLICLLDNRQSFLYLLQCRSKYFDER